MESYPKVLLNPDGEWKPLYLDDGGQLEDYDDYMRYGVNVYATSYTQSNDVLETILSVPQHKPPSATFADDVAFAKGSTEDKIFLDIPELDTHKFDNYDGFYTSPSVSPFGPRYVYTTTHPLISSSSSIAAILPAAYIITPLVRYCINGIYSRKWYLDIKKPRRLFLFKPHNDVMKTL